MSKTLEELKRDSALVKSTDSDGERVIGERFYTWFNREIGLVETEDAGDVEKDFRCRYCAFRAERFCNSTTGPCDSECRADKRNVYFKRLELNLPPLGGLNK